MDHILPYVHLNHGWSHEQDNVVNESIDRDISENVGKHCILELYECDSWKLDDEAFIRTSITTAAKLSGATIIKLITHRFEPQGVTGLALLAESLNFELSICMHPG